MAIENISNKDGDPVTDENGNPLQDAVIALFLTNKNASDGDINDVKYTRTDSNGEFVIKDHPDADGTSQEWHVAGYYQDGTGEFNALSKPSVEASVGSAIPASVVSQYDATKESSTGSISSITDQQGFADLSGNCTVESSVIDGKQAFRFQNETMSHFTAIATSDPFAVVAVIKLNQINTNNSLFDGSIRQEFEIYDNGKSRWAISRGGSFANLSASKDTNAHIFTLEGINSNGLRLEIDDTTIGNKTLSSSNFNGLHIGGSSDNSHPDVHFGQVEILKGHTPSELQSVQDRLKTKWNTP